MVCDTRPNLTQADKDRMAAAVKRLDSALNLGAVKVVIGRNGAVAFNGWQGDGVSDLCAYRRLSAANSPALRRAVARAEALAGRKVDPRMLAAGMHSHDGGKTFSTH